MSIGEYLPPEIKKASVVRKLQRSDFLFQRNTPAIGVYEVLEGRVSMSRLDPVGRDVILFVATPGETLAEATILVGIITVTPLRSHRPLSGCIPSRSCFGNTSRISSLRLPIPECWSVSW